MRSEEASGSRLWPAAVPHVCGELAEQATAPYSPPPQTQHNSFIQLGQLDKMPLAQPPWGVPLHQGNSLLSSYSLSRASSLQRGCSMMQSCLEVKLPAEMKWKFLRGVSRQHVQGCLVSRSRLKGCANENKSNHARISHHIHCWIAIRLCKQAEGRFCSSLIAYSNNAVCSHLLVFQWTLASIHTTVLRAEGRIWAVTGCLWICQAKSGMHQEKLRRCLSCDLGSPV